MKIKVQDLLNVEGTLVYLTTDENVQIPFKANYWLDRLIKTLTPEYESIRKNIKTLQEKYAELDKEGNMKLEKGTQQIVFKDYKGFAKDYEDLTKQEITVEFEPIPLSLFGEANIATAKTRNLSMFINAEK